MAELSPMSRLLIASALTGAGTSNVHFVDADRASFSYSSSTTVTRRAGSDPPPSARVESDRVAPTHEDRHETDEAEDEPRLVRPHGAGETRGGPRRRQQQQQRRGLKKTGATAATTTTTTTVISATAPNGQPRSGQVGLLEFDPRGRGSEFVVSSGSSLPERLTVTADAGTPIENQGWDGEEPGDGPHGGSVRGRGGGDTSYNGQHEPTQKPVCVKYLATVGQRGVLRKDWFPSPDDARSLRAAIDSYCPIPFLRGEGEGEGEGEGNEEGGKGRDRHRRVKEDGLLGEGERDAGGGRVWRLLLYQRDQDRQIRNAATVRAPRTACDGWRGLDSSVTIGRQHCEIVSVYQVCLGWYTI